MAGCVYGAAWMPGSLTLTNPGLESLKAGGPLSEDLFAGDASVPSTTGRVLWPHNKPFASTRKLQLVPALKDSCLSCNAQVLSLIILK